MRKIFYFKLVTVNNLCSEKYLASWNYKSLITINVITCDCYSSQQAGCSSKTNRDGMVTETTKMVNRTKEFVYFSTF